ncbi:hypothetical protein V5O48_012683 [Marasmius crinis-equi]|uniref:Uncharacterized protein n=1 Tax=Marasmius crinis-equi TaxID=585013 RepID=A0ABR3F244_9AGAR
MILEPMPAWTERETERERHGDKIGSLLGGGRARSRDDEIQSRRSRPKHAFASWCQFSLSFAPSQREHSRISSALSFSTNSLPNSPVLFHPMSSDFANAKAFAEMQKLTDSKMFEAETRLHNVTQELQRTIKDNERLWEDAAHTCYMVEELKKSLA